MIIVVNMFLGDGFIFLCSSPIWGTLIHFDAYFFNFNWAETTNSLLFLDVSWELFMLGRKLNPTDNEAWNPNMSITVEVAIKIYSHKTYIIVRFLSSPFARI